MNHGYAAIAPRKLTNQLIAAGITLPTEVTDAIGALDALEARKPSAPAVPDLVDAYRTGKTDKQIDALASNLGTFKLRNDAWKSASDAAGNAIRRAITGNGNTIVAALRDIAEPLIDTVTAVGNLNTADVATLVRDGRTDDAEAAARIETHAGQLANLYRLRDLVTKGADYGHQHRFDCGTWHDPRPVKKANAGRPPADTPGEVFVLGIRAGGTLWFPTPDEAQAVARGYLKDAKRANEQGQVDAIRAGTAVAF